MPLTQSNHTHAYKRNNRYQRGVFPEESFRKDSKYGTTLLVSADEDLTTYVQSSVTQVRGAWANPPPPSERTNVLHFLK